MTADLLSAEELTLDDMAARLGVSNEEVLRRERAGDLFSYVRQSRGNKQLYPLYQLASDIHPDLIRRARRLLNPDLVLLHHFFTQRDPDMAHLSVREVLAGRARDGFEPSDAALWLLSLPMPRRMEAVQAALEREHAVSQGW